MNSHFEFFIFWEEKKESRKKEKKSSIYLVIALKEKEFYLFRYRIERKKFLFISLSHWKRRILSISLSREKKRILFISLSHKKKKNLIFRCRIKRERNLINLQLIHSLQKNCENCESCNNYTIELRKKTSLCESVKIAKNIILSFTCHVITLRALLDVNILTIIYKLYLSYIVEIQCVYHLFLTKINRNREKHELFLI